MTTLFALGFCLALLSGFWLAARLGRRGWSPLAATLAGCVLALTVGYVGWSRIPPQAPVSIRKGGE